MKKEVFDMYDEIELGSNEKCKLCKKLAKNKLAGPISVFHVGSDFKKDEYKIVFAGKNTWYDKKDFEKEKVKGKLFADVTETGRKSIKGEGIKSAYWNFIISIVKRLKKDTKNIAITNLIKCNTTGETGISLDRTPKKIIACCIDFGVFQKEINVLNPNHIIFFTGRSYDDYIQRFDFGFKQDKIKDKGKQTKIKNNKKIIWWEREFYNNEGKIKLKTLRTYHPGYLQRRGCNTFSAEEIVKWIKNNSKS